MKSLLDKLVDPRVVNKDKLVLSATELGEIMLFPLREKIHNFLLELHLNYLEKTTHTKDDVC